MIHYNINFKRLSEKNKEASDIIREIQKYDLFYLLNANFLSKNNEELKEDLEKAKMKKKTTDNKWKMFHEWQESRMKK